MCNTKMHAFLQALPKCEHHMHVEGALSPGLLFDLAAKNNVTLPEDDPAFASPATLTDRYNRFTSLDDFLHYYYIGFSVLITTADFEALALDYFHRAAADGVVHAEIFFDPQAHLSRGVDYNTFLNGFNAAREKAQREMGITSELICCFLRHLPAQDCLSTFQLATIQESFSNGKVIGIGLDSSELAFPPELFTETFEQARKLGLKCTAHAGEEGPVSYIGGALDKLQVSRIDHGVKLPDDKDLLKRVADQGIMLSVCPYSVVILHSVNSMPEVPIRKFLDADVQFSINSDDPAYFGGHYILDNYCVIQETFQLSMAEWHRICASAINGSWCSDVRKSEMMAALEKVVADHSNTDRG